jgi:hypothetical protein
MLKLTTVPLIGETEALGIAPNLPLSSGSASPAHLSFEDRM